MTAERGPDGLPVHLFETEQEWATWLDRHHATSTGAWLRHAKKGSGLQSVSYGEALDVALCYGWIDGQKKGYDDASWLQRWTPRGPRSIWSKVNREKALALIESGRMQPAGMEAVQRARKNGRWDSAYDSQSVAVVPEDLEAALEQHPAASAFFATLDRLNRYAIIFRVQTAKKPETRARRITEFITMLERGEKPYP